MSDRSTEEDDPDRDGALENAGKPNAGDLDPTDLDSGHSYAPKDADSQHRDEFGQWCDRELAAVEDDLRKLNPSALGDELLSKLTREYQRIDLESESVSSSIDPEQRLPWWRMTALVACTCLLVFGYVGFHYSDSQIFLPNSRDSISSVEKAENVSGEGGDADVQVDELSNFLPVSAEGRLLKTSSGGIEESENGPMERMRYEYEDVYHWRNPETGTNLRVYKPSREESLIPVETY